MKQGCVVLLWFPDVHPGARHHCRQLGKSVQNGNVNVFLVCRATDDPTKRIPDRIAAHNVDSYSSIDGLLHDGPNRLGYLWTSGPTAITGNPRNKQGMRRRVIKQLDQVRNSLTHDTDRRFAVATWLDATIAKIAISEICPGQSSASWVNRQNSTELLRSWRGLSHGYDSLWSKSSRVLNEARTRSS